MALNPIEVNVTSNFNSFQTLRRFPLDITIFELKSKLELLTGASSESMQVQLLDKNQKTVVDALDNERDLKSYPIESGMFLHVVDPNCQVGEYEDVSAVKKFELSAEKYNMRSDTFRAFKEKCIGNKDESVEKKLDEEEKLIEKIHVGDRCEVHVVGQPKRRGTVRFLGKTDFKPGCWVGVEYDEPLGKNDGSCQGKRYFECQPKYGGFVKPRDVIVGDFPVELDEEI